MASARRSTGEKGQQRFSAPGYIPGVPPELARFLQEQFDAIKSDLDGLHRQAELPPKTRAVITTGGLVLAHVGDTLRVLPPETEDPPPEPPDPAVRILLPKARNANKGGEVAIIVLETPWTVSVPVTVEAIQSQVQGTDDPVTLEGPGLRIFRSDGDGGWWIVGQSSENEIPLSNLEDVGGLSVLGNSGTSTGPVTAITATGRRQFLASGTAGTAVSWQTLSAIFPGAPIYDVMAHPFNATGDGIADDTAAINAAIAAANAVSGTIYLGPAHRITAALTAITGHAVHVQGRGELGGTHIIEDTAGGVDVFTFSGGSMYSSLRDVWIQGFWVRTAGWGVRVVNCFRHRIERVLISQKANGVEHVASTLSFCTQVNLEDLYGVYGFLARGTDVNNQNQGVFYTRCVGGTGYPLPQSGSYRVWATGTSYNVGDVVFANSALYQCAVAGTSAAAGTGPIGIPSVGTSTAHTTQIIDNSVRWVFAMPFNTWFLQSSWGGTFEGLDCGTLQGGHALGVEDPLLVAGSNPLFCRFHNLEIDHCFGEGVYLTAGASIHLSQLLGGSLQSSGVFIGSGVSGNWSINGGEIFGCNQAGIVVQKGDGAILGVQIGGCGNIAANTRDCIEVAAGVSRFRVSGCSGGAMFASTSPLTRYGISIGAGCNNYLIDGNVFIGNLTGGILNTPGRSSTRVVLNNVPDVTISPGSVWGLQVDAAGAVPIEIIGTEQGENLRRETVVVDATSSGTVATYAIANITTQVQFKLAGALTINGMTATSATFGKRVVFSFDSGFAGSVTWNNESGSAGGSLERVRTPSGIALTIVAGETAEFEYFDSRWRCVAIGKNTAALSDGTALSVLGRASNTNGPRADIVANSGTNAGQPLKLNNAGTALVFGTVDTPGLAQDAADNTILANMANSTIKGRLTAGTGNPEDLTGAQVVTLLGSNLPQLLQVSSAFAADASISVTPPTGATWFEFEIRGAGGGGGGAESATDGEACAGAGGGEGELCKGFRDIVSGNITGSIGTGGTGGASTGGNGGNGGSTTLTYNSVSTTVAGGFGGNGESTGPLANGEAGTNAPGGGGDAGTTTVDEHFYPGADGHAGIMYCNGALPGTRPMAIGGHGGGSCGAGGPSSEVAVALGGNPGKRGGGGAGAVAMTDTTGVAQSAAGGAGGAGYMVIRFYSGTAPTRNAIT